MVTWHGSLNALMNALAAGRLMPTRLRPRIYRAFGLDVNRTALILNGVTFNPGRVSVGTGSFINQDCILDPGSAKVTIGAYVAIGARVVLVSASHDLGPSERRAGRLTSRPVSIEDGAWLGTGVTVLGGVTIARGCVIAAGAVVNTSTTPDGLYAGVPARRIRDIIGTRYCRLPVDGRLQGDHAVINVDRDGPQVVDGAHPVDPYRHLRVGD